MNDKFSFGQVDQFVIFGGGQLLFDAVAHLLSLDVNVSVVTSNRHYHALIKSNEQLVPLNAALGLLGAECELVRDIDGDSNWEKVVDKNTIGISLSAEWIFKQRIIEIFHGRLVNLHGSRLPAMKGGGGLSWNILMGSGEGGATIHFIDEGIDTGDILMQDIYDFPMGFKTLQEFLAVSDKRNNDLIIGFLNKVLANEDFLRRKQYSPDTTYWPRLKTDIHGFINWTWCANDICSFIAAFGHPYSGASTLLGDKMVKILQARVELQSHKYHPFQYGIIFHASEMGLHVASKDGDLIVEVICDEKNKLIAHNGLLGTRFYTPSEYLETAMRTRIKFVT